VKGKKPNSSGRVTTEWRSVGDECLLYDESKNIDLYSFLRIECISSCQSKPKDDENW
jgi:hypothetical protein